MSQQAGEKREEKKAGKRVNTGKKECGRRNIERLGRAMQDFRGLHSETLFQCGGATSDPKARGQPVMYDTVAKKKHST